VLKEIEIYTEKTGYLPYSSKVSCHATEKCPNYMPPWPVIQ
jgi:hypothetical protein